MRAGMLRIAFDLGRPAFVAFRQDAGRDAAERGLRGVEQRTPGNQFLGLLDIRRNVLGGLASAGGQSAQSQRGAHQLEKIAAAFDRVFVVGPADSLARKFPLQQILEFGGGGEFVEAAPILFASRSIEPRAGRGEVQFLA